MGELGRNMKAERARKVGKAGGRIFF